MAQIIEGCRAISFRGFAHLELRDELAEILVALCAIRRAAAERAGSLLCWCGSHAGGVSRGPKLDTEISAPICARTPLRFALVWKRAAP